MSQFLRFVLENKNISLRCSNTCPDAEPSGERIASLEISIEQLPLLRDRDTGRVVLRAFLAAYHQTPQLESDTVMIESNSDLKVLVEMVQDVGSTASTEFTINDLPPE